MALAGVPQLGIVPCTKRLLVRFPVSIHTWIVDSIYGKRREEAAYQCFSLILMSLFSPFPSL